MKKTFGFLGVPFGAGARWPGCSRAPSTLRDRGLLQELESLPEVKIHDYGNTNEVALSLNESKTSPRNLDLLTREAPSIIKAVTEIYADGHTPVIIGGDHSISISTFSAAQTFFSQHGKRLGLLWVDAHPDICTPETSETGNIHGMSVAHLMGKGLDELKHLGSTQAKIHADELVYIGLRSVDPPERECIKSEKIQAFTIKDIDCLGMANVISTAIETLRKKCDGIWLSFDLDVCDPDITPGVGTPVRGGLTYREAHLCMELVAESGLCMGIELVEYSPDRDTRGKSAKIAIGLLKSALGQTIL